MDREFLDKLAEERERLDSMSARLQKAKNRIMGIDRERGVLRRESQRIATDVDNVSDTEWLGKKRDLVASLANLDTERSELTEIVQGLTGRSGQLRERVELKTEVLNVEHNNKNALELFRRITLINDMIQEINAAMDDLRKAAGAVEWRPVEHREPPNRYLLSTGIKVLQNPLSWGKSNIATSRCNI